MQTAAKIGVPKSRAPSICMYIYIYNICINIIYIYICIYIIYIYTIYIHIHVCYQVRTLRSHPYLAELVRAISGGFGHTANKKDDFVASWLAHG